MNKFTTICCVLLLAAFAYAATGGTIQLPKTGQITSQYAGDDGSLQKGAAWPAPRFTDNGNGTVTDNLTGLIWMKNANCTAKIANITPATDGLTWADALTWSNNLASGTCGLTDGSIAGQWRVPNINELESLVDLGRTNPALPNGHPFSGVQLSAYWSSTTDASSGGLAAWFIVMDTGYVNGFYPKTQPKFVWPVSGGQ